MKQSSSKTNVFITLFIFLTIFPFVAVSQGQSIELSSMGNFTVDFTPVKVVENIQGSRTIGQVTAKPGSIYKVNFPFDIQQIKFAVNNGELIKKGNKVGEVSGFDVHHFLDELEAAKNIFITSEKHYLATKASAESHTLKSTQWLDITKNYNEAKLAYEHFSHLEELIHIDKQERFWVLSPMNGIIYLDENSDHLDANTPLFEVIPVNGLNIKTLIPEQKTGQLLSLITEDDACKLNIQSIDPVVKHYRQAVWSTLHSSACNLVLGQKIILKPIYSMAGFVVPKQAVFEWENDDYVAIKEEYKLTLIRVSIVGKKNNELIIESEELEPSSTVLTSSVSIAQGLFMGLGD